uniref:Uncharacterized protein n=1 Tax=Romanomermis culicivorax TaxID=13658 RepID=A0A915KFK9_ROMCU
FGIIWPNNLHPVVYVQQAGFYQGYECGRLRNTSSPYISDNCFKDLDFIACSLSEFFRGWKKLYKGECNNGHSGREAKECNTNLKKKLLKDMWPIYTNRCTLQLLAKMPMGSLIKSTAGQYVPNPMTNICIIIGGYWDIVAVLFTFNFRF